MLIIPATMDLSSKLVSFALYGGLNFMLEVIQKLKDLSLSIFILRKRYGNAVSMRDGVPGGQKNIIYQLLLEQERTVIDVYYADQLP